MLGFNRKLLVIGLTLTASPAMAQPAGNLPAPTPAAAMVNGQAIPETWVQRGLRRVPPAEHAKARTEIVNYLIDNMLVDQYLAQQKIPVDAKDLAARLSELQAELKKQGQEYQAMLKDMSLSEDELKAQILADVRWEKYASLQGTDAVLKQMYEKNGSMFDGTQVRARHILLMPQMSDAAAFAKARAQLVAFKQQLEAEGNQAVAKLPPSADPLARENRATRCVAECLRQISVAILDLSVESERRRFELVSAHRQHARAVRGRRIRSQTGPDQRSGAIAIRNASDFGHGSQNRPSDQIRRRERRSAQSLLQQPARRISRAGSEDGEDHDHADKVNHRNRFEDDAAQILLWVVSFLWGLRCELSYCSSCRTLS